MQLKPPVSVHVVMLSENSNCLSFADLDSEFYLASLTLGSVVCSLIPCISYCFRRLLMAALSRPPGVFSLHAICVGFVLIFVVLFTRDW